MTDLTLTSENGKYELVLRDIDRGYAIIDIKSEFSYPLVEEATALLKKYNPKKIYVSTSANTGLRLHSSLFLYEYKNTLTKSYKDIKLNPVELSNREALVGEINKNISYFQKSIDNIDMMSYIKNKSAFYFTYKKEMCGVIIVENNEIEYLVFDEDMRYSEVPSMCLSKALYQFGTDLKIQIDTRDEFLRSLVEEYGFENKGITRNYYEVE